MSTLSLTPDAGDTNIGAGARDRRNVRSRRRTVSTSFEQSGAVNKRLVLQDDRKTVSYADNLTSLVPVTDVPEENNNEDHATTQELSLPERIPCFGIILIFTAVSVFQAGSVVAKKMTIHPMMMLLLRDIIQISFTTPFTIQGGDNPFPRGKILLVMARGLAAGCQLTGHFYAVRS